jgi:beta-glucosidase
MSPGDDPDLDFPQGFLWGAAGSAHQIEGGNTNSDWWEFEHAPGSRCAESSADGCDSFHRWPDDLDLVANMGLGSYRFSLEWSRIEPAEGEFSLAAMDHYRRICAGCHERGIIPVVTFHHFTNPSWLARRGGFEDPEAPDLFARFVERAGAHLGDLIGWGCTINEPNVIGAMGYTVGDYPPGVKDDLGRHLAVNKAMVRAHRLAVEALRSGPGTYPVGLTLSMAEIVADEGGEVTRDMAEDILEDTFLRAAEGDDFVGVQAYTRMHFGPEGLVADDPSVAQTQMGTENWPGAVAHCVRRTAAFTGLPVLISESGIATDDDAERIRYLGSVLHDVHQCMTAGIDVRGFFVWSLLDNFEWNMGYGPKLGLHAVDRKTFARTAKPSAAWYGAVAGSNRLAADSR